VGDERFIELAHVEKAFGEHRVYEDLCLRVVRGEALTIVGASGSGKSVLLKMLMGLVEPDRGEIHFDGQPIHELEESKLLEVRRRIAMLFQGGALFDSMSVGDNVAYPLREAGELDAEAIRERVADKLRLVGLEGCEDKMPGMLSGGMKKRVALARAIAAEPEVILFDEPTAGLDPVNTRRVTDLIRELQRELEVTVIVVTHDLPAAYRVSDRIAMLHEGRMLPPVATDEFRRSSEGPIQEFVGAMAEG
jgi:phospholipid/cholesterol/gamma-HCH transport system ATP-binding protein